MFYSNCIIQNNNIVMPNYNSINSELQTLSENNSVFEFSSINVKPDIISQAIDVYQCFGWRLLSNREINIKDTHPEYWGLYLSSMNESGYYCKLTFKCDKNIKNYIEIRKSEEEYYRIDNIIRLNSIPDSYGGRNIISHFKLFIAWCKNNNKMNALIITAIVSGIIIPIIGAIIVLPFSMIVLYFKFKKEVREKSINAMKLIPLLNKLVQDARALLNHCNIKY